MRRMVCPVLALVFFAVIDFHPAPVSAQTRITIGVAAMSPRTIPLLIAEEQSLFAKHGTKLTVASLSALARSSAALMAIHASVIAPFAWVGFRGSAD